MQANQYGTTIVEKPDRTIEEITQWILTSNELSVSVTSGGMQLSYDYFFQTKKEVLDNTEEENTGV